MTPAQLKKELLKLDSQILTEIIIGAINRNMPFKNAILEQLSNKIQPIEGQSNAQSELSDSLLQGIWKEMKKIVAKANREGYEDSATRNKFDKFYTKIETLLAKQVCSRIERMKVLEEMMEQRGLSNCGFINDLDELLFLLCYDRRDWIYLQKQYTAQQTKCSTYQKQTYAALILKIQKDKLADEETYIELAKKNLYSPTDYLELGKLFIDKRADETEGLAILKQGLLANLPNSIKIVQYLFEYYVKHNKEKEIAALVGVNHIDRHALSYLLDCLYQYYKPKDYEITKRIAKQKVMIGEQLNYQIYTDWADFFKPADWATLKAAFVQNVKKLERYDLYNQIMIAEQKYQEALNNMDRMLSHYYYGMQMTDDSKVMFRQIAEKIPKETIGYAEKLANRFINYSSKNSYEQAAILLKIILEAVSPQIEFVPIIKQKIDRIKSINANKIVLLEEFTKHGL